MKALTIDIDNSAIIPSRVNVLSSVEALCYFCTIFNGNPVSILSTESQIDTPVLNISIGLDLSGSMLSTDGTGTTRLDRARDAITMASNYMRQSSDRLALTTFSYDTWLNFPFTSAFGHNKTAFNAALNSVFPKDWTNIGEGFERARAQFSTSFAPPPHQASPYRM